jgi:streptogramin lyase
MMCVHETSDHVIWIATDGGGVSRFDGASFTNFSTKHGLAADVVFFFYQDLRGNLWVGTNAGLSRWNPRKQRFTSLKAADGLYSENVFQMAEDNQGDVWFGSAAGIFRIRATALDSALAAKDAEQPFRLVCMAYNKMDGMQTVDCNVPVISPKDRDGNVWIMTKKGVVLVNPRTIKTNTQAPPVLVQSLTVDGTTLLAAQASASRMTIPPGKEQFVFDYTALSFTASERVHFRYKLENFDADWLDAQERRTAYYTKLPSGTYTFRVIACNNDGVWNTNGASLTFIVQPHLWQTTWFAALCLVAAGASAWGVFRWQVRRMRLRNMLLERTVGERTAALQHANNELGLVNQEVQRQNKLLSQQAVDIQIANTTLYEKNAQLEALNTEKNEFLGIVAHDLKNPLAKITMAASILQLYWQKMQQSEIQQRLQAIEETALSMAQTVTNLLD